MDIPRQQIAALSAYPVVIAVPVQWGDQDALQHVNNVVFLRWFESARIAYFRQLGMAVAGRDQHGLILAAVHCDFQRPVTFPDTIHVGSRVTRIGRSSMDVAHAVWSSAQQAIVAQGHSTVVVYDYQHGKPLPVPNDLRTAITQLEGKVAAAE
jgi:acyl-CoA thioester hydrolase